MGDNSNSRFVCLYFSYEFILTKGKILSRIDKINQLDIYLTQPPVPDILGGESKWRSGFRKNP
jgi:hypothetical protein